MKNVWKGLVIGAFTGAGIGLLVDLLETMGRSGQRLSAQARGEASHLGHVAGEKVREADLPTRAKDASERLVSTVRDAELPDKARHAADAVVDKLADADVPQQAQGAAQRVASSLAEADLPGKVQRVASTASDAIVESDIPERARAVTQRVVDRATPDRSA